MCVVGIVGYGVKVKCRYDVNALDEKGTLVNGCVLCTFTQFFVGRERERVPWTTLLTLFLSWLLRQVVVQIFVCNTVPNQQRTLNKLPTAEILLIRTD